MILICMAHQEMSKYWLNANHDVSLTKEHFDQVMRYNLELKSKLDSYKRSKTFYNPNLMKMKKFINKKKI